MNNDLISREALIKAVEQGEGISWERHEKDDLCVRKKYIDNAPTVVAENATSDRPTGEWIYRNYNWWCSVCGEQPKTMGYVGTALFMHNEFKFCNHCGAKMTGGADMRVKNELKVS